VGMFTLGYDGGLAGYPELVGDVFSLPVVAVATVSPAATEVLEVTVAATLYDGLAVTDGVRLSNDGTTWSGWLDPATAPQMAWQLNDGVDGPRVVYVQSRDVSGALSTPFEAAVVLDRTAPIIDTLSVAADGLGGWKATFAFTDPGGLATLELRSRGPDGVWSEWTALDTAATSALVPAAGTDVEVELRATDRVGHVTVMSAAGSAAASPGAGAAPSAPSPGASTAPSPSASAAPSAATGAGAAPSAATGAGAAPSPGASTAPSPGAGAAPSAPSPGASAAPSAATGVRPTLPSIAGSATA